MRSHSLLVCALVALLLPFAFTACDTLDPMEPDVATADVVDGGGYEVAAAGASASLLTGPRISSLGGISDGVATSDGRWTGQPMRNPRSDQYKGWLALETHLTGSSNPYTWSIRGSGFGSRTGTVTVTIPPQSSSTTRVEVVSWTDTRIVVRPRGMVGFAAGRATISVRTSGGASTARSENVMELIRTRGAGQCTYHVALQRHRAGLTPPVPRAYSTTGAVGPSYVPRRWDALTFGSNSHVGIIASTPRRSTRSDGTVVYTFTLSEQNARADERVSTSTRTFEVRSGRVTRGIGTNASGSWVAEGYFR